MSDAYGRCTVQALGVTLAEMSEIYTGSVPLAAQEGERLGQWAGDATLPLPGWAGTGSPRTFSHHGSIHSCDPPDPSVEAASGAPSQPVSEGSPQSML